MSMHRLTTTRAYGHAARSISIRRTLATTAAAAATALILTPTSAFAAGGGPGGKPVGPGHSSSAPGGPVGGPGDAGGPGGTETGPGEKTGPAGPDGTQAGPGKKTGPAGPAGGPGHKTGPAGGPGHRTGPTGPSGGPAHKTGPAGTHKTGPAGPHKSAPAGPIKTTVKLTTSKVLTSAKPVIVSARVSPAHRGGHGTPAETGTVVFTIDGATSSPVKVVSNKARGKVKFTAGKHTISAKYSGDAAHAGSDSGPVGITVS